MDRLPRNQEGNAAYCSTGTDGKTLMEPKDRQKLLPGVVKMLDEVFNPGLQGTERTTGFIVVALTIGQKGPCDYVSNGVQTSQVIQLLRQLADGLEKRQRSIS